ncbi:MAG: hypothetical protein JXP34_25240 [Planctomycetes bacterium]|nr:hypothetical protein [Planctomycetota bacterium]
MGGATAKTARVLAAIEHREADRVPIGEFFWSSFVRRARETIAGGGPFDPYRHWDLDLIVINPNMDPRIRGIEIVEERPDRTHVRTGFGATIELRPNAPMPRFLDFEAKTIDDLDRFAFDDPADPRRYTAAIDDQINGVADALNRGYPSFADRVAAYAGDFCIFGGVCEPFEMLWRIIGSEAALILIAEEPDRLARFVERLGAFLAGIARAQIEAAQGRLAGLYLWGDVAYDRGMLFDPGYWREVFAPQVRRICDAVHDAGLRTIYHGCGNASAIFDDLIEAGVDVYNPLEAKAGLDVVALKRRFGPRWAFNGNLDVRVLSTNDRARIRTEVLRKLNAAKGGGFIVQSDHSVPGTVDPETYDYVVRLVREHGRYPIRLGALDEAI